jgi:hypothetical protein
MELVDRELLKILKYYNMDNLGLVFDGYEPVNPDKILYYWHAPKTGELYVAVLADFITEFAGDGEPGDICEDYWPEHTCDWQVDYWLCSDDAKWFYWPECGDKCAFAKLRDSASVLNGRRLERAVPTVSEEEMLSRKIKRQKLTEIDSQAHN